MITTDYDKFLSKKIVQKEDIGFDDVWIPDWAFPFQGDIVSWGVRQGYGAIFADCGLGKTPMSLIWSANMEEKLQGTGLILTPLAVSNQFITEGKKFGIGVHNARQSVKHNAINVINYEQLHKLNPSDFKYLVCDECFSPDTKIETLRLDNSLEFKYIKNVLSGDRIINASGVDHVKATAKRRIDRVVILRVGGREITCSENHPFFTMHGWRLAKDLRSGDYLMETKTAVCLVRGYFQTEVHGQQNGKVLRNILLSEMADEYTRTQGESAYERIRRETGSFYQEVVEAGYFRSQISQKAYSRFESNVRSYLSSAYDRHQREERNSKAVERQEGWEWTGYDTSAEIAIREFSRPLDCRISSTHRQSSRLSYLLQSRYRQSRFEDCYRSRWEGPCESKEDHQRREESGQAGFVRVDSSEILESTNSRMDRYREADGSLYFYDLEATKHPSYSVNGLLVHNSGILKNYDGTRRKQITEFCHRIPNKLLGSATPAPNDYTELGSSSEALEVMERDSMLGRFFSHSGKTTQEWELKGHSRKAYWRWVATWARAIRKPSDFGYDDGKFVLPPIDVTTHTIKSDRKGKGFFNWATDMESQRKEKRNTIDARCRYIADMIPAGKPSIVWCDLNDEGDLLEKLIPNAIQVSGKDSDDIKEKKLLQFTDGSVECLVTKAKIGGFGMNWQHCADVFCFPTHSFESHYQKIRRCYRFGQQNTVKVRIILTEAEKMVLDNMFQKEKLAIEMFDGIIREMQTFQMPAKTIETNLAVKVPSWL